MKHASIKFAALMLSLSATCCYAAITTAPAATSTKLPNPLDSHYADSVISTIAKAAPKSLIDAFIKAKTVVQNPSGSGAAVCIQTTPNGQLFRSHSTNSNLNGIVTLPQDIRAFRELFSRATNDSFVLNLPEDPNNPQSPTVPFPGKIFYKDDEGVCIARYAQSTPPTDADYPELVLNYTGQQNASMHEILLQGSNITPSTTGAIVCVENTPQGLYRSTSTSPTASGLITLQQDITAFTSLFGKRRGDSFTLQIPENADGTGSQTLLIGRVIYADTNASRYCIARYTTSAPAVAPASVPVVVAPIPVVTPVPAPASGPAAVAPIPVVTPVPAPASVNAVTPVAAPASVPAVTPVPVVAPISVPVVAPISH